MIFTIGPVLMHDYTKEVAGMQLPYFRTAQFSEVVKSTTAMYNAAAFATEGDETIFLTCSGTGAMEATVLNCLSQDTKVLIINGGTFGERWVELCKLHSIPHDVVSVPFEKDLDEEMLKPFRKRGYFALLVNIHETGIGKLYDAKMLSRFCAEEGMYFFADAISSIFADEYKIKELKTDITIVSSQKALALTPGLAVVTVSERLYNEVILKKKSPDMYFSFAAHITEAKRGQTPFTPAVGIIFQLQKRLEKILEKGVENVIKETNGLASYFRQNVVRLPVEIPSYTLSNCITPILLQKGNAKRLFEILLDKYDIHVTPSPQPHTDKMLRISSIGALEKKHYDKLLEIMDKELKNLI